MLKISREDAKMYFMFLGVTIQANHACWNHCECKDFQEQPLDAQDLCLRGSLVFCRLVVEKKFILVSVEVWIWDETGVFSDQSQRTAFESEGFHHSKATHLHQCWLGPQASGYGIQENWECAIAKHTEKSWVTCLWIILLYQLSRMWLWGETDNMWCHCSLVTSCTRT